MPKGRHLYTAIPLEGKAALNVVEFDLATKLITDDFGDFE